LIVQPLEYWSKKLTVPREEDNLQPTGGNLGGSYMDCEDALRKAVSEAWKLGVRISNPDRSPP
jgi:hypothetical protein